MMKFFALLYVFILAISLVNAGFFTPSSPQKNHEQQEHIYSKDVGAVLIEVEENHDINGNTKVYVSPKEQHVAKEKLEQAKDKVKETGHQVKETAFGAKETAQDVSSKAIYKAKEQVHDGVEAAKDKGQELLGISAREAGQKNYDVGLFKNMVSGLLLHLLGFAVAYGTCVWVTFGSSYVMAGALPGLQLAMLQSKTYPLYFKAMAASVGISLLGYLMMSSQIRRPSGIFNLIASLAMVLVNMIYLEPHTTKMMFERMKKEKEEHATEPEPEPVVELHTTDTSAGKRATVSLQGEAKTKEATTASPLLFMRLNSSNTSLVNVATLVSLTCHLLQLAQQLHAVC